MTALVLLNLLNELGKRIRCETLHNILPVFRNEFFKSNYTGTRMQVSTDHMTLKSLSIRDFRNKMSIFRH